jgi:hypothetical protein
MKLSPFGLNEESGSAISVQVQCRIDQVLRRPVVMADLGRYGFQVGRFMVWMLQNGAGG